MRNKTIVGLILFTFIFCASITAQEKKEKTDQKIELPELYLEQKLDRTVTNLAAFITSSIAYTKSMGKTAEDYGKFIGETFTPSWEGAKGKGISPFIQGMYRNLQPDKNFRMEILSESKTSVEGRMNRYGEATVKAYARTGVTNEEVDACFGKVWETIANYLGLEYKQKAEGDWIVFTITEKTLTGK